MRRLVLLLATCLLFSLPAVAEAKRRAPVKRGGAKVTRVKGGKLAKAGKAGKAQKGHQKGQTKGGKLAHRRRRGPLLERIVATYRSDGNPNIQAEAAVVLDLKSGKELFAKNGDAHRPIASISKLMAMMVVLDRNLDLDGVTEILQSDKRLALRGARSRLPPGQKFTNRDLLHAALMASDNRAVPALGRAVGLDPDQMAAAMTKKARELGLPNTSFGDPTGLDERNRSTAREVARMVAAAMRYPLITEITSKGTYIASPVGHPAWKIDYQNTDLVARGGKYQVLAGKTGYTDLAGYCLTIAARIPVEGQLAEVSMAFLGDHEKLTRFGDFSRAAQWIAEKKPAGMALFTPSALTSPTATATAAPAPAPSTTGGTAAPAPSSAAPTPTAAGLNTPVPASAGGGR